MRSRRTTLAGSAALAVVGLLSTTSFAGVPDAISYQGVLLDPSGEPASGTTTLRFRIYRGGDDTTIPSTGVLVYHERATVGPTNGVFSHLIGTGIAEADCVGGPCALGADAFAPGDAPVWIEITLDPDGEAGTADDDVLLPRTRLGTVGYAYRVESVDGATAGSLTGNLSVAGALAATTVAATDGIAGPNVTSGVDPGHAHTAYQPVDPDLDDLADGTLTGAKVEPASETAQGTVSTGVQSFAGAKTFVGPIALLDRTTLTTNRGFVQHAAPTFPGGQYGGMPGDGVAMRFFMFEPKDHGSDAAGSVPGDDTEFMWVGPYYNASALGPAFRENPNDYNLGFKFTAGWTNLQGERAAEYQWQHVFKDGSVTWYPFSWNIGRLDTSAPVLDYVIKSTPDQVALQLDPHRVSVMAPPLGKGDLEVAGGPGGGTLYLGGASGGRLKFEGAILDTIQTIVAARNPTAPRSIQLPDDSGLVHLNPPNTGIGTVMFGTSADDSDTGNEVCQSVDLICVGVRTITGVESDCSTDQGSAPTLFHAYCRR